MHSLTNNVLGTLKYDITGASSSLVVQPISGTAFSLPPAPTDAGAGSPTYGKPYGIMMLVDRLDLSQAKFEIVLYTARAAEAGGAYTYSGLLRGQEGSSAQAWTAGNTIYVIQPPTEDVLAQHMQRAVLRSGLSIVHDRESLVTWDGANLKFATFLIACVGRGKHFSTDGYYYITMPPNGTTVTGFGGASNQTVASGAIPIPESQLLWYEPSIGSVNTSLNNNFRLTSFTGDFIVPQHWIFLAAHLVGAAVGQKICRLCTGVTLNPWREVGAAGNPAFLGTWVNFGGSYTTVAFFKGQDQIVRLKGIAKTGTIGTAIFTLPTGYRPSQHMAVPVCSNSAYGQVEIYTTGDVTPVVGNNASVTLDGITFPAAL